MKKKMGRPRKKKEVLSSRAFARAGIVMSAYDEARENGQKHSVAIRQSVEVTRERHPKIPISETGVRRILSQFRPRKSHVILRFKRSTLTGEALAKHCWILDQLAALAQEKGLKSPEPSNLYPRKSVATYQMSFGEKPNYPRHNRKFSKG
jgi:hypothetical protein